MKRSSLLLVEFVVGALISALAVVLVAAAPPGQSSSDGVVPVGTAGCYRSTLVQPVAWTTSGLWSTGAGGDQGAGGDRLLLADAGNKTIDTFDAGGRFLRTLGGVNGSALANLHPLLLRENASTRERMVEVEGNEQDFNRMVSVDEKFAPRTVHLVQGEERGPQGRIFAPFQWEPVDKDIVAFVDVEGQRNDYNSAIVRYPLGDPEHFTPLHFVPFHDLERTFYRLGYQYITSLGTTAYVLTMGNTPGIYKDTDRNGKKSSILVDVRRSLSTTDKVELNPQLPEFYRIRDYVGVMAAVERAAMPTGIYGWDGHLYVLSRIPEDGRTIWVLRKFDPKGELLATVRIPAEASHLTPVPGPHYWAFVEKGPVKDYVVQDIKTILFVPSALLQANTVAAVNDNLAAAPSVCR